MKIDVDRVSETPTAFDFELGAGWWRSATGAGTGAGEGSQSPAELGVAGELAGPLRVACRAWFIGDDLYLEGVVEGEPILECSRCLERYRHGLREGFRLVLEPARDRLPADPEGAKALAREGLVLSDELEAGWFQGKQIDLDALVVEVVSVALPAQPLCAEDCKGLCQHCGANLNAGECSCPQVRPDSPFAVLAGLRDGMKRGED